MGAPDCRHDETLDPDWNLFSERVPGSSAHYVAVPCRNAIPRPPGISALEASVMGTAWLTAYRILLTKSGLKPGQPMLVQGGSGGVATALIQLGRAAGMEVWATSRPPKGGELAERLGAHRTFARGEKLPRRVEAVMDSVGQATWPQTLESVGRGGAVVTMGITTGNDPSANLMRPFVEQGPRGGTLMGTRGDIENLIQIGFRTGL